MRFEGAKSRVIFRTIGVSFPALERAQAKAGSLSTAGEFRDWQVEDVRVANIGEVEDLSFLEHEVP